MRTFPNLRETGHFLLKVQRFGKITGENRHAVHRRIGMEGLL